MDSFRTRLISVMSFAITCLRSTGSINTQYFKSSRRKPSSGTWKRDRPNFFSKALLYCVLACAAGILDQPRIRALAIPDDEIEDEQPFLVATATKFLEQELKRPQLMIIRIATIIGHTLRVITKYQRVALHWYFIIPQNCVSFPR